jgi:hypothetical protein
MLILIDRKNTEFKSLKNLIKILIFGIYKRCKILIISAYSFKNMQYFEQKGAFFRALALNINNRDGTLRRIYGL